MNQDRWNCKFKEFVSGYGVSSLAAALDVDKTAIHHWVSGRTVPRPAHAVAMQFLAEKRGIELSLDSIYEQPREFLAQAMSATATDLPAAVAAVLRKNPQCR